MRKKIKAKKTFEKNKIILFFFKVHPCLLQVSKKSKLFKSEKTEKENS